MGFFFSDKSSPKKKTLNTALLQQQGCLSCDLNRKQKINPKGTEIPYLYVLGEEPYSEDSINSFNDDKGNLIVTALSNILGFDFVSDNIRFNSLVYCRNKESGNPTDYQTECCRKKVIEDIEKTKPLVVFGFGELPLKWITGKSSNMSLWRGRKFPVKIGNHVCWYFPMLSPSYVLKNKKDGYLSEEDRCFDLDIRFAKEFMENYEEPVFISGGFSDGVRVFKGEDCEISKIEKELDSFMEEPYIGIDIETIGLRPYNKHNKMLSISLGTFDRVIAFPLDHDEAKQAYKSKIFSVLEKFLLEYRGGKICQNLKFELEWFNKFFGKEVLFAGKWEDTLVQAYVMDERTSKEEGMLSLDTLCFLNFGFRIKSLTTVDRANCAKSKLSDLLLYNGMDSKWEYQLFMTQKNKLDKSLEKVYNHIVEVQRTLALTQAKGIPVDFDEVNNFDRKYSRQIAEITERIKKLPEIVAFERTNGVFNPASGKQLVSVLKDYLKIPEIKKTLKGGYSTDDSVLSSLKDRYALCDELLKLREVSKLHSTYILPKVKREVIHDDNLIHPDFNACFTSTGRMSAQSPNTQNYPKRENKEVRNTIAVPNGKWLAAFDYGQIEARAIASESNDKVFIEAVKTGYDIHKEWAVKTVKKYPKAAGCSKFEEMNDASIKEFRQQIKNQMVFPWFYGAGYKSVGRNLGIPEEVIVELYNEFWEVFHGVKEWQKKLLEFYKKTGYTVNAIGRRRHSPMSTNEVINSSIQGVASDIVTNAMNRLSKHAYELNKPQYQAIMNIHDDLTFILDDATLEQDIAFIANTMCEVPENFVRLKVPVEVEVSVGRAWGELEEISKYSKEQKW